MKDSVNQVKLLLLVVLLLPTLFIISEDIENITFPSIERHDPLAVYDIWDEGGNLHPNGPFTIEDFSSIVDDKVWFGYKRGGDSIVISDGLRLDEASVRIILDYIDNNDTGRQLERDISNIKLSKLVMNLDRKGILEKTESIIDQSALRETILKNIANFFWIFERKSNHLPLTVLNSEIFYGKEGWIFSKNLSFCPSPIVESDYSKYLLKLNSLNKKIIILPVPLKGHIVREKLLPFQMFFIRCNEVWELNKNIKIISENLKFIEYVDLFDSYINEENSTSLYSKGNTHWSDLGLSIALVELLSTMDQYSVNNYIEAGRKLENNEVLERLGLISLEEYEKNYDVRSSADFSEEKILVIRDSFLEDRNGGSKMKQLFDYDEIHWNYIEKISSDVFSIIIDSYSMIIIESSIENLVYSNHDKEPRLIMLAKLLP